MPVGGLPPAVWLVGLSTLVVAGSIFYQVLGYVRLRKRHRELGELKARQRRVYRSLEALQRRGEALAARVPPTVRAAPYTADDEKALALNRDLLAAMAELHGRLRPLAAGPALGLAPLPMLLNQYWLRISAVEDEIAFGIRLRADLEKVESLADDLGSVLVGLAHKPTEVRRNLADVQALADALLEDIELEKTRGTGGLAPLAFETQAVRGGALEWGHRLAAPLAPEDARVAIEAEAKRLELLATLARLYSRVENIAGVHDRALGRQERLDAALQSAEAHLTALRPALAEGLEGAMQGIRDERRELASRYRQHDAAAYQEVAEQAWTLMARVRALGQQMDRLAEVDSRARGAADQCAQALAGLLEHIRQERSESPAELDLSEMALQRLERYLRQMNELSVQVAEGATPAEPAALLALLDQVEARAQVFRQEEQQARDALAAWQVQRRRAQEVLARLEASDADHERLSQAWKDLDGYNRTNWPQVEAEWYEAYACERAAIMEGCRQLRTGLSSGQFAQSSGGQVQARCEELGRRWQRALRGGQRVTAALSEVRDVERQANEALAALRADVQGVAATAEELPADLRDGEEVRQLGRDVLARYRRLEDEARWPARTDFRRLRDEGIAGLQEQLAVHKLSYAQLVEGQRSALKRQLGLVWEQWEPLSQRLAKAAPESNVDREGLEKRWQVLLAASRPAASSLAEVFHLQAQARALAGDLASGRGEFEAERDMVRIAEQRLAQARREAAELRDCLPPLLAHHHPQVVDEEWERSGKAWQKADTAIRRLEPRGSLQPYLDRLDEAAEQYREAHGRARSALARLLRYAFLEDPDGMHLACLPLGRGWGRLGVTAREDQIRELLAGLEKAGRVGRLVQAVNAYLLSRGGEGGGGIGSVG